MRAQIIAILTVVAAPLIQATLHQANIRDLGKRQGGDSFIPGTSFVNSCAPEDLCGTDWCLDRPAGDICCKEGYACPGGSFCLTQGYCCPEGDSLADCAAANGITLSAGFDTSALPSPTAAPSTSSMPVAPTPASNTVAPVASSSSVALYPVSTSAPAYVATGSGTGAIRPTSSSFSLYTGGAAHYADIGGTLAVFVGLLGYVF